MSGRNRSTALAFHEACNDVDLDGIYELLHPDVEVRGHDGRISHGPDEAVASMLAWRKEWKSFVAQLEEFTDMVMIERSLLHSARASAGAAVSRSRCTRARSGPFATGRSLESPCIERGRRPSRPQA